MGSRRLLPVSATRFEFCHSAVRRTSFVCCTLFRVARDVASGLVYMHKRGLVYNSLSTEEVWIFQQERGPAVGKLSSMTMVTGELIFQIVCCRVVAVRATVLVGGMRKCFE